VKLSGSITLGNCVLHNASNGQNCSGVFATRGPDLEFPGTSSSVSIQGAIRCRVRSA
jgi:hypothetical protein